MKMGSKYYNDYYGSLTYWKVLCPPFDCSRYKVPPNQDVENGEEYVVVVKPDKVSMCLCPIPIVGMWIAPIFGRSVDVHSIRADGTVVISRHFVCHSDKKSYANIIGCETETQISQGESSLYLYYRFEPDIRRSKRVYFAGGMGDDDSRIGIESAVNQFLKRRRTELNIPEEKPQPPPMIARLQQQMALMQQQQAMGQMQQQPMVDQTQQQPMMGQMQQQPMMGQMQQQQAMGRMPFANYIQQPPQQGSAYQQPGTSAGMQGTGALPPRSYVGNATPNMNHQSGKQSIYPNSSGDNPSEPPPAYLI